MAGELPPPPINRHPNGLLDFFGIKNGGRNPQYLLPSLSPTIDLLQHYAQANAINTAYVYAPAASVGGGFLAGLDGVTDVVVPPTEMWLIAAMEMEISILPGNSTLLGLPSILATSSIYGRTLMAGYVGSVASDAAIVRFHNQAMEPGPHYIPPGSSIKMGFPGYNRVSGSLSIVTRLSYVPLRI